MNFVSVFLICLVDLVFSESFAGDKKKLGSIIFRSILDITQHWMKILVEI